MRKTLGLNANGKTQNEAERKGEGDSQMSAVTLIKHRPVP